MANPTSPATKVAVVAIAKMERGMEELPELTVSKYESGARSLRAAAPALLLRLLAATSRAAPGRKCDGVKSYHALRVYHTHPRGNPSFIGVVVDHLRIRV